MFFTETSCRLDLRLLLLIPVAQSGSTGETIREILEFNSSDPDMTRRFLLATLLVITLSLLFGSSTRPVRFGLAGSLGPVVAENGMRHSGRGGLRLTNVLSSQGSHGRPASKTSTS